MSDRIGLVRDGQLEQAGTPEDLYARPRTAYAADFVGAANIVPVQLSAPVVAGGVASVQLAGAALQALAPEALPSGKAALIARPERLVLLPDGALATHQLPCTVRRRQYLGARTIYAVELDDGARLRVESDEQQPALQVGARARMQLDPRQTRVVAA